MTGKGEYCFFELFGWSGREDEEIKIYNTVRPAYCVALDMNGSGIDSDANRKHPTLLLPNYLLLIILRFD